MHDVIGIGLGPFNLGLAALLDPIDDVDEVFLEARDEIAWHPGMLLAGQPAADTLHVGPRDDGRPHVPTLVPPAPQGDGSPLPVLHPRVVLSAAP